MPLADYARNKLNDALLRNQALGNPLTWYVVLYTVMPTASTAGTLVTGIGYAPVAIATSLTQFSGTQGTGTIAVSSGASGESSNNVVVDFGTVGSGGWGTIVGWGMKDGASGNLWIFDNLRDSTGVILTYPATAGVPIKFSAGNLKVISG